MNVILQLFVSFFKIGLVSFGGGYAMIPIIEREVETFKWLSTQQFTDAIAIAGMSPGPIAANSAIFVGYKVAGISGALSAGFGIIMPSLLLILIIGTFFFKFQELELVKNAFYGLRPVIVGLIAYASVKFALRNNLFNGVNLLTIVGVVIMGGSIILLNKTKIHPVAIILGSGVMGILFLR